MNSVDSVRAFLPPDSCAPTSHGGFLAPSVCAKAEEVKRDALLTSSGTFKGEYLRVRQGFGQAQTSGCSEDPETFDLFEKLESRPAIEVMQDKKAVEVAIYLLVDSIEGF